MPLNKPLKNETEIREQFGSRAEVFATEKFICIITCSGRFWCVTDLQGEVVFEEPDATALDLGIAVRRALSKSRFYSADEARSYMGKVSQAEWNELESRWLTEYEYGSRTKLYRFMVRCGIRCVGELIKITPSAHERLSAWAYLSGETVTAASDIDDAGLGNALRVALGRCIS